MRLLFWPWVIIVTHQCYHCVKMHYLGDDTVPAAKKPASITYLKSVQEASRSLLRYRAYLKSCYSYHSIARDDKLSIAPCTQFVDLTLVKKGLSEHPILKPTFFGSIGIGSFGFGSFGSFDFIDDIQKSFPLKLNNLVAPDSRFVLIEGPPGIGKSTLCWELCRQWETLESLERFKLVLQLKLQERRIQNATSLNEIFFHRDQKLCQSVVDEVLECEGEGVLLILDGFDEMPTSVILDTSSLIVELISGMCLPKATRLLTSRPSALHHEKLFPEKYGHIEILGFTDESKVKFAEIAFEKEPELSEHFKRFNPIINSLMCIPINCAIVSQVYEDISRSDKLIPKTMTQLYSALVLVLIRRHMVEKKQWDEFSKIPNSLADLPEEISASLRQVSELAYKGLIKEDIQLVFTDSEVGDDFQHLGLLSETKELYVREGARSSFSFPHLMIQEFLAAWHILHDSSLIETVMSNPQLLSIQYISHLFLAGLVGLKIFPEGHRHPPEFLIHCFYEAQNPEDSKFLLPYSKLKLHDPLDMYVFGYTLVYAPIKWDVSIGNAPFDMIASGIADYSPGGSDVILGSIRELDFNFNKCKNFLSTAKHLSKCLLQSATKLVITIMEEEELLYEALKVFSKIEEIELHLRDMSVEGMKKLCEFFSSNHTLESVALILYFIPQPSLQSVIHELGTTVLSCSTVKSITTDDIPFKVRCSDDFHGIEHIHFKMSSSMSCEDSKESLFSLADLCKLDSMKTLVVRIPAKNKIPALVIQEYEEKLLQRNPSMEEPKLIFFEPGSGGCCVIL